MWSDSFPEKQSISVRLSQHFRKEVKSVSFKLEPDKISPINLLQAMHKYFNQATAYSQGNIKVQIHGIVEDIKAESTDRIFIVQVKYDKFILFSPVIDNKLERL